jgi:hypothetical protein
VKKLAASISLSVILSMLVFAVPTFAHGSTTTPAASSYNNDGMNTNMTPSTGTTTTNSLNRVDPYGSYYNSTINNSSVTPSASPRMNSYGIRSTTPNTVNYGTRSYDTANTNLYRARAATTNDNDIDWGWLGLLGLIGLAGLRGKNRERT